MASISERTPAEIPITVAVYPAARVKARLEAPRLTALPDRVLVSGRARHVGEEKKPVEFELSTEVGADGSIAFDVPAALIDLRIAASGMAPVYRWKAWPREGVIDFGLVELVPGGSLMGYVVDAQTGFPVPGATLRAIPAGIDALSPADQEASESLPAPVAQSDDRGGFQLVSLPPGAYRLEAEHPNFLASERAEVRVVRDAETILGGDVVLSRPLSLRVMIDPPRSPEGLLWEVVLREPATMNTVASLEADGDGLAGFDSLTPATLRLVVGAGRVTGAFSQDLEVESDLELAVNIPLVEIHGRVTMEDEPVTGDLRVSTGTSDWWPVSLDEEGYFQSWIRDPRFDFLFLEISGEGFAAPANVVAEDIAVRHGKIEIDVELLDLEISGKVVTPTGKPVSGASVYVRQDGQIVVFTASEDDGSFSIRPLQPGEYIVDARQPSVGTSQRESVVLSEASAGMETRLVIQPSRRLAGQVTGPAGEAVVGARVITLSVGPNYVSHTGQTDANGRWVARMAAEARQAVVLVAARGYPFWSACLPVTQELGIQLPAVGGWLELASGNVHPPGKPASGTPLLVNELGGLGLFAEILGWSRQHGGGEVTLPSGEIVFRIPNVAPGRWGQVWSQGARAEEVAASCGLLLFHSSDWQSLHAGQKVRLHHSD